VRAPHNWVIGLLGAVKLEIRTLSLPSTAKAPADLRPGKASLDTACRPTSDVEAARPSAAGLVCLRLDENMI
jgi:hypothetical protein